MIAAPLLPLTDDAMWDAVCARDRAADGRFVTAVATTRIYCRPSCTARHPLRKNVRFYPLPAAAEAAGFRPCKRCHPRDAAPQEPRAALVQAVCDWIETHLDDMQALSLEAIGVGVGYTPSHLQKTFKAVLGITPRDYADARRTQAFKAGLRQTERVTDAIYDAGYTSTSRVYERADDAIGMTPGAYRAGGAGIAIGYALAATTLGTLIVGATARGVCIVGLADDDAAAVAAIHAEYPRASIAPGENDVLADFVRAIMPAIERGAPIAVDLPLDVQATAFQRRVWAELRRIPAGETRSYAQIAAAIGQPTAARAVASACAANQAAVVIPCHRVIGSGGALTGYKWGTARKAALLAREKAPR